MQAELRRLAHGADEQQDASHGQRVRLDTEEVDLRVGHSRDRGEDLVECGETEEEEGRGDAEREAEVAHPVDDEGLDRRRVGAGPLVPEADQQIGAQAHALPAEEHLQEVVGRHQRQHEEGEEAQVGEEARPVRVVGHVAHGIDVDNGRDRGHHHEHDRRQLIDPERPGDLEVAGVDPGEELGRAHVPGHGDVEQHDPGQHRREPQQRAGRPHGRGVADPASEEAGDDGADQRQKDDGDIHARSTPSSC